MDSSEDARIARAPRGRVLGRIRGEAPGPTLVVVAGMHGNELGGVEAVRRVLARLGATEDAGGALAPDARGRALAGELVCLAGNLAAMQRGRRYQAKDLNRQWTAAKLAALATRPPSEDDPEDAEQRALLAALDEAAARARGEVLLVDLHTTSAAGYPFVIFGDTLRQRAFVSNVPVPVILGLEEQVDGVLTEFATRRGWISFAMEGGQHDDPRTVDALEATLWLALAAGGLLARDAMPEHGKSYTLLDGARGALPRVMEVLRRHAITQEDEFRMEPGFANLARVRAGERLARDVRGEIRAPHDGVVMLPLYQGQGEDGFFWGRAVGEARMRASTLVRRLGLERALPWLPGVRRAHGDPHRLLVDTRVARFYPLDVFHLFGFRRRREHDGVLLVERRPD